VQRATLLNDLVCGLPLPVALCALTHILRGCGGHVAAARLWGALSQGSLVALATASEQLAPTAALASLTAWEAVWDALSPPEAQPPPPAAGAEPTAAEDVGVAAAYARGLEDAVARAREAAYRHVLAGAT
jgi:hypothetical protein